MRTIRHRWAAASLLAVGLCLPASAAPGPAGVLVLADSNGEGHFGGTLYDGLRAFRDGTTGAPLKVSIFAKCGAGAIDFTSREWARIDCTAWACDGGRPISQCRHFNGGAIPELAELYRTLGAERRVTVVVLGINMVFGDKKAKLGEAVALIDALKANNSGCIWVGPPQAGEGFVAVERFERFVADLETTVTAHGCRYIASDDKTDRRDFGAGSKDDHYDKSGAIAWAKKVLAEMETGLKADLARMP